MARRRSDFAHAPTIDGFCFRHGWSRSTWNNRKREGRIPKVIQPVPGGKVTITPEYEAEFDHQYARQAVPVEAAE
jgi:hypothetical protein